MTFRAPLDRGRGDGIVAGLDPPAPVAFGTGVADRAVADEVDLRVPLAVSGADRTKRVEIAAAVAPRNAVERVGVAGAGAIDVVRGVGPGELGGGTCGGEGV